jgi:prepilin-type N-terminal cleavage/methylation domain-containing protein
MCRHFFVASPDAFFNNGMLNSLRGGGKRTKKHNAKAAHSSAGFTLIELMVVSAIFMVLSSVVLSANTRFGNKVVLQNLAHEMALTVREAQVYGIAVRRFSGSNFDVGYGMYFTPSSGESQTVYQLFGDVIVNGVYDPGETVRTMTFASGYSIVDICARDASSSIETCSLPEIHILFYRPEPDALIRRAAGAPTDDRVRIVLESPRGARSEVHIEASGQIAVQ